MELGAVGWEPEPGGGGARQVSAVEFGGGCCEEWHLAAVEVERPKMDEQPRLEEEKWEMANRKKIEKKKRQAAKKVKFEMPGVTGEEQMTRRAVGDWERRIEEAEVYRKRLEESCDRMRVEVKERFIGAVKREDQTMGMTFQVAGVKKALAAVWRICKAGNIVQFGEAAEDCFVKHKETGKKVMLERKGGSYVLKVEFVRRTKDGASGELWESLGTETITVDSGAEESVCPLGWGAEFGMTPIPPGKEMRMVNAGGGEMKHYGSRRVAFGVAGF